jgi:hypothetical protein
MNPDARAALAPLIDTIESSYEFMLAYAAQGRDQEASGPGPSIRATLMTFDAALGTLCDGIQAHAAGSPVGAAALTEFLTVARPDAAAARAAIRLALAAPAISSQLIDNLNASIHIRALLTDIFLVDEALKSFARTA